MEAQLSKTISIPRYPVDVTPGWLSAVLSGRGTDVEVGKLDGKMKRIPAKIVRFPHYDPDKARVRS